MCYYITKLVPMKAKDFYVFATNTKKRSLKKFLKEHRVKSEETKPRRNFASSRLDFFPRSQKMIEEIMKRCKKMGLGVFEEAEKETKMA